MENPGRAGLPGFPLQTLARSVGADVHGAIAQAVRGLHEPGRVAAFGSGNGADNAEAEANVVMEAPTATPAPARAERLGGSGGRRQRGGARGSRGNESK